MIHCTSKDNVNAAVCRRGARDKATRPGCLTWLAQNEEALR